MSKYTWKNAFALHRRGFKIMRKLCPALYPVKILQQGVQALAPYVGIFLSAQIINELAGSRRPEKLWFFVLMALGSATLFGIAITLLKQWDLFNRRKRFYQLDELWADKLAEMDFSDTDSSEVRAKLSQIKENRTWNNWGLERIDEIVGNFASGVFGILGAAALTASLFTQKVPESGLAVLNHPVFILVFIAVLTLVAFLGPACKNKAESYYAAFAEETKQGNRLGDFVVVAEDSRRAADVRMYNQQKIARHYLESDTTFFPGGVIAKCAKGPMGLWNAIGSCISAIMTGLVYVFVCLKAWAGAFGVGSVTQYVGAVTALSGNIGLLIQGFGTLKNNTPFLSTVIQFLDIPNTMYQGSLTTEKRSDRNYEVEFKDVSFKYPSASNWALRHVNMKFKVGSRLAVVGENGSGKTTFIKLLCRLYDPQEGQILLNGIDIRKYNYRDYMDVFSVVFQDFQLISQPLGNNVSGSMAYDKERVLKALKDAGFSKRLSTLPQGLDTYLYKDFKKEGVDVSGGEAQKIAIARALYKDAPFIILDEPTAALDPIAEAEIYSKFNDIADDRTAIYISHRLSSCKFCDEIAVFQDGAVVQQGTHEGLLADEKGKYYELWNAQAQYYMNNPA